ncbi:MAG TPA: extracellular solute-binding protein [Opitutaceae bacterium]|nr:extracellular solute-binding protein [Opitutaceae bacterium]
MSTSRIKLRGITWNHSRGFLPMAATAQRFGELHPEVEITWDKRSLRAFEDQPVERLATNYDLIVLDHPAVSQGARHGALLPLDENLPAEFLLDQARNSVGASHASYAFDGHHWALAIDAATPVAFWREDLLAANGGRPPQTWEQLLDLARAGRVEVPAAPINCLMNFYSLCLAAGETPFTLADRVASRDVALAAFLRLRELLSHIEPGCWDRNPIASHDRVAGPGNTAIAYCPLAYGYSNYAREGYAAHRLAFGEPPLIDGAPLRTTLGGAGLGVSAKTRHPEAALAYAQFVASASVQRTVYTQNGGQPGHRAAWNDEENNRQTGGYFANTLPVLDRAYLRPHYPGYLKFQDHAGPVLHDALRGVSPVDAALDQIDLLYRHSRAGQAHAA